jgi:hypothetical protein
MAVPKARLVPVYFATGKDADFDRQLDSLHHLLADEAEILSPVALGASLPDADAVLFPQLLGEAYSRLAELQAMPLPSLILTSEFGSMSMWDWEINAYLRHHGLTTLTPHNLDMAKKTCRALALRRDLRQTRFLLFQDNPGEGMQADIFKRFFWWEKECTDGLQNRFGVTLVKRSFQALAQSARQIPDADAEAVVRQRSIPTADVTPRALNSAVKLYLAVKRELAADPSIKGVGINCLNESRFCDTTPCLAWNLLYEEQGMIWACEADVLVLMTKYLLHVALGVPIMMTNLYPFLMGMAALKHERIPAFPEVADPDAHLLAAHCGYFGVVPQSFSTDWVLRPKVLAIVDDNATAIDARMPVGDITLAKLHPSLDRIMVVKAALEGYAQYPGSDCRNGAVLRVPDGHRFLDAVYSHHYLIATGDQRAEINMLARVFDLQVDAV